MHNNNDIIFDDIIEFDDNFAFMNNDNIILLKSLLKGKGFEGVNLFESM